VQAFLLNGRLELLRLLSILFPEKDYKNLIVERRNDVVHQANFPDETLADQVSPKWSRFFDCFPGNCIRMKIAISRFDFGWQCESPIRVPRMPIAFHRRAPRTLPVTAVRVSNPSPLRFTAETQHTSNRLCSDSQRFSKRFFFVRLFEA
jgi:hypothetical protein